MIGSGCVQHHTLSFKSNPRVRPPYDAKQGKAAGRNCRLKWRKTNGDTNKVQSLRIQAAPCLRLSTTGTIPDAHAGRCAVTGAKRIPRSLTIVACMVSLLLSVANVHATQTVDAGLPV